MEQTIAGVMVWPRNRTATRDLYDDFARIIYGVSIVDVGTGVDYRLMVPILAPNSRGAFDWNAAEKRADWEESHGRFAEFGNLNDLLADLHS